MSESRLTEVYADEQWRRKFQGGGCASVVVFLVPLLLLAGLDYLFGFTLPFWFQALLALPLCLLAALTGAAFWRTSSRRTWRAILLAYLFGYSFLCTTSLLQIPLNSLLNRVFHVTIASLFWLLVGIAGLWCAFALLRRPISNSGQIPATLRTGIIILLFSLFLIALGLFAR